MSKQSASSRRSTSEALPNPRHAKWRHLQPADERTAARRHEQVWRSLGYAILAGAAAAWMTEAWTGADIATLARGAARGFGLPGEAGSVLLLTTLAIGVAAPRIPVRKLRQLLVPLAVAGIVAVTATAWQPRHNGVGTGPRPEATGNAPPEALHRASTGGRHTVAGIPRIIDADTVEVAGERIRLNGIDAPETKQQCRDAQNRRYRCGQAATEQLRRRVGGQPIQCALQAGRDRYGRALGICFATDGTDLNGWLVEQGWALAYRRYSTRYAGQEAAARAARAGMHQGAHLPPWEWRRGTRLP